MRHFVVLVFVFSMTVFPAAAVDFLGVELCEGSVDTSVVLPVGSPLSLESSEIGRYGGLLLLFKAENGDIMDHIDNLMAAYTDTRGTGDAKKLQWTGNQLTAYAQLIKKGYAALAVSTTDPCAASEAETAESTSDDQGSPEDPVALEEAAGPPAAEAAAVAAAAAPAPEKAETPAEDSAERVAAAAVAADHESDPPTSIVEPEPTVDFRLKGTLKHAAAEDGWVDVMGVVVNISGDAYSVASFDLSLYDGSGDLICVDTISVNQLRDGQERAFRSAIRCTDYNQAAVASWKLQFAGAH